MAISGHISHVLQTNKQTKPDPYSNSIGIPCLAHYISQPTIIGFDTILIVPKDEATILRQSQMQNSRMVTKLMTKAVSAYLTWQVSSSTSNLSGLCFNSSSATFNPRPWG